MSMDEVKAVLLPRPHIWNPNVDCLHHTTTQSRATSTAAVTAAHRLHGLPVSPSQPPRSRHPIVPSSHSPPLLGFHLRFISTGSASAEALPLRLRQEEEEPVARPLRRRGGPRHGVRLPLRRRQTGGGPEAARGPRQPLRLPQVPHGLQRGARLARRQGAGRRAALLLRRVWRRLREPALLPGRPAHQGPLPGGSGGRGRLAEGEADLRAEQERAVGKRLRPRRRLPWARRVHRHDRCPKGQTDLNPTTTPTQILTHSLAHICGQNRYYDMILSTKLSGLGHAAFLFMTSARDKASYVYPNVNAAGAGLLLTETFTPPSSNLSQAGFDMWGHRHCLVDDTALFFPSIARSRSCSVFPVNHARDVGAFSIFAAGIIKWWNGWVDQLGMSQGNRCLLSKCPSQRSWRHMWKQNTVKQERRRGNLWSFMGSKQIRLLLWDPKETLIAWCLSECGPK